MNSETDFVTKSAGFQQTVAAIAKAALRVAPAHVSGTRLPGACMCAPGRATPTPTFLFKLVASLCA